MLALDSVSKRETGRLLTPAVCPVCLPLVRCVTAVRRDAWQVFRGFDGCWDRQVTGVDSAQRPLRNACG